MLLLLIAVINEDKGAFSKCFRDAMCCEILCQTPAIIAIA